MPPRRFHGGELRAARRLADLTQKQLASGLGLTSHVLVANWESKKRFPPAEKLVRIAAIIGVDVDELFPREGPCDLVDLRCDAGYTQSAAAEEIEGLTRFTLGAAEGGNRRLDIRFTEALSALYGVTPEALEAAQDQSFGVVVSAPDPPRPPSPAEKLKALVDQRFPDAPTPAHLANAVNMQTGTRIEAEQIAALLAGASAKDAFAEGAPAALAGMAAYFGVNDLDFEETTAVERRVLSDLQHLADRHGIALTARDGELSGAMLAVLNSLVANQAR
ncbi:helix-turn-helix domain-containing protein [Streptomyces sp. NPDC001478]